MVLNNPETYNFYKLENKLKKKDEFLNYIEEVLDTDGINEVIRCLKSSGTLVSIFGKTDDNIIEQIEKRLESKFDKSDSKKLEELKEETLVLESLFEEFSQYRDNFFTKDKTENEKFIVASYLISLELYLLKLSTTSSDIKHTKDLNEKSNAFDSAIESTGMILRNFMFKKNEFTGINRNIAHHNIKSSESHIYFSSLWLELNDLLEYWKYSNVDIQVKSGKIGFEIMSTDFELNNLVSNERFLNLRQGWQMNAVAEIANEYDGNSDMQPDKLLATKIQKLNYLSAFLYFGSPLLNEKIKDIELHEWLRAYELIIQESKKFLKQTSKTKVFNLNKVCMVKSISKWKRFFRQNGYSPQDAETIIQNFTFNRKSLDLIDFPFIKVDDSLLVVPSLTANSDPSRALASNFLTQNVNLDFKGKGFEERCKVGFTLNNIKSGGLYKKNSETEYECDVAFILDNDLYFVECKAHVQPFTTRQHANHLYKLYKETLQLNRIVDYFSKHLDFVRQQLDLKNDFEFNNIYKILLTTSMVGTPLKINNVFIVDESSFTMLIDRKPPSLTYFEKGKPSTQYSTKFDIYNGNLTSNKMIEFLNFPPQIRITQDFYQQRDLDLKLFHARRNIKVNQTIFINPKLNGMEKALRDKFF